MFINFFGLVKNFLYFCKPKLIPKIMVFAISKGVSEISGMILISFVLDNEMNEYNESSALKVNDAVIVQFEKVIVTEDSTKYIYETFANGKVIDVDNDIITVCIDDSVSYDEVPIGKNAFLMQLD